MSTKKMQIIGLKGKSAYQYAQDGGYTGTEAEFKEKMAKELDVVYDYDDLNEAILATAIKPEVSGEFIHITDSAALPIMDFGMEGKTEQESTRGVNLFDKNTVPLLNELLQNDGTPSPSPNISFTHTDFIEVLPNETYTIVCLDSKYIFTGIYSYDDNKTFISIDKTYTGFVTPTNTKYIMIGFCKSTYDTFTNEDLLKLPDNIMLVKGSSQPTAYEPYTGAQPSPNPDYPQEIINAGTYNETTGRYEIGCKAFGKNVLSTNPSDWINSNNTYYKQKILALPNTTNFTITVKTKDSTNYPIGNVGIGSWTGSAPMGWIGDEVTTLSMPKFNCVYLYIKKRPLEELLANYEIQVEWGSVSTESLPYTEQRFTLTSPVPITKWDKLVKRDGVYGWSILSKEHEITGRETFNSGGDTYYTGSSTNMYLRLDDITSLANLNTQYIYCNELSFIKSIWDKTDGSVGMITNGEQLHLRLPNKLLGVSDDSARNDKIVAHRVYLEQRYDAGNPLKLLYKVDTEQSFHPLPDSEQALLKELETYYQVTNIYNDQGCPMSIQYVADTQTYVDNLTTSLTNAVVSLGGEV